MYEETLAIADQETEMDLRVLDVALTVGADGVERVEETVLETVLVAIFAEDVESVAVLAKTLKSYEVPLVRPVIEAVL